MGLSLLADGHWEHQYDLSLQLYQLSASISCMCGDKGTMKTSLYQVIHHIKSFEDSLEPSLLLAKLLVSQSKFKEAIFNMLDVLKNLGEEFPDEVSLKSGGALMHLELQNELSIIQKSLANITVDQVKILPRMTDTSKLNAMRFLSLLCTSSVISQPLLTPLLSCRMVRLTMENGYCDETIGKIFIFHPYYFLHVVPHMILYLLSMQWD